MSHSGDGIDMVRSIAGLSFYKYAIKTFQINTCLYLSKGSADYISFQDIDEFFIPKGKNSNFIDVLDGIYKNPSASYDSTVQQIIKNGRARKAGYADNQEHPFCYISVKSEVFVHKEFKGGEDIVGSRQQWISDRYGCIIDELQLTNSFCVLLYYIILYFILLHFFYCISLIFHVFCRILFYFSLSHCILFHNIYLHLDLLISLNFIL